jgi:dihydrofolate synthase/folylpolyglutamate synthase
MHFEEALQYLLSLGHETLAIKLGLRNTELLLSALDHPERSFRSVQISGTNGKGSTATMLDSICRAAGIKSGLYTSPHLVSITERITVAGVPITEEEFASCATRVRAVAEQLLRDKQIAALPTFFEQVTAIALTAFQAAGIELAVLETGLGGRLDATTAANAEFVGITPIAMDHEQYLGNTLERIAAEKAATIRAGVSVVIGKQPAEVMQVLLQRCGETGVKPVLENGAHRIEETTADGRFCVTFQTAESGYESVWLGLRGSHQIENTAIAIRLAELLRAGGFPITGAAITSGIYNAKHAGRLEIISHAPLLLLDGAHNPAGASALRDYLDRFAPRPLTMVFGAMLDKQLDRIGEILFPIADLLVLTTVDNPRSAAVEMLDNIASRYANGVVVRTASSAEAFQVARTRTAAEGMICVTGSLYLIGELRPLVLSMSPAKGGHGRSPATI